MARDPEKVKAYKKKYYQENKERISQQQKVYCQENNEEIKQRHKKYYQENKEEIGQKRKVYFQENKEKIKEYKKEYRQKNKEEVAEKNRKYTREKRKTSALFKFISLIRSATWRGIKSAGAMKDARSEKLLGCSFEEGHDYIATLFKPGMSWENHGSRGWHIDHIKPIASFNLTDPEEQKKCFHYTNLQPLWAEENIKKGSKILNDT